MVRVYLSSLTYQSITEENSYSVSDYHWGQLRIVIKCLSTTTYMSILGKSLSNEVVSYGKRVDFVGKRFVYKVVVAKQFDENT